MHDTFMIQRSLYSNIFSQNILGDQIIYMLNKCKERKNCHVYATELQYSNYIGYLINKIIIGNGM